MLIAVRCRTFCRKENKIMETTYTFWYTLVAVLIYKRAQVRDGKSGLGQEDKGGGRLQLSIISNQLFVFV